MDFVRYEFQVLLVKFIIDFVYICMRVLAYLILNACYDGLVILIGILQQIIILKF